MIDVALHLMIYISRILHIAFSSSVDPLFYQSAYYSKRYYCKKSPSLASVPLVKQGDADASFAKAIEGVDLTTTKLLF